MSGDGKRGVAEWPKLPRPSSTLPSRHFAATQDVCRFRSEADMSRQVRPGQSVENDPFRKWGWALHRLGRTHASSHPSGSHDALMQGFAFDPIQYVNRSAA
jgi:hypothetical protein